MSMLVVRVVDMWMSVFDRFVPMLVLMIFSQMQPETERHEKACNDQLNGHWFMQDCDGRKRAQKRGRREIRASPRGAEMS